MRYKTSKDHCVESGESYFAQRNTCMYNLATLEAFNYFLL